jgi:hypothetical protein
MNLSGPYYVITIISVELKESPRGESSKTYSPKSTAITCTSVGTWCSNPSARW